MNAQTNTRKKLAGIIMVTLCATIWGTAFIAQSLGSAYNDPFTFNCSRSILATAFLLFCCFIRDKLAGRHFTVLGTDEPITKDRLIKGGIVCGISLALGTYLQQLGVMYTTVGKSGFITTLYIVIVPLLNYLVTRRPVTILQGAGVALAVVGMYFICIKEGFSVNKGDIYVLLCAFCFAAQIICVDNIIRNLDGLHLSLITFATGSVFNGIFMFIFEEPALENILAALGPIAYAGIMSNGVAYTLQMMGQKYINPVLASMIMSLESPVALLSGWVILGQAMDGREIFGCVLVFAAIMLAQIPDKYMSRETKTS